MSIGYRPLLLFRLLLRAPLLLLLRLRRSAELVFLWVLQFATTDWGIRLLPQYLKPLRNKHPLWPRRLVPQALLLPLLLKRTFSTDQTKIEKYLNEREEDPVTDSGLVASLKFFDNYNHRGGRKSLRDFIGQTEL